MTLYTLPYNIKGYCLFCIIFEVDIQNLVLDREKKTNVFESYRLPKIVHYYYIPNLGIIVIFGGIVVFSLFHSPLRVF